MNLTPWVYIVHRGKIVIKQNEQELVTLTKVQYNWKIYFSEYLFKIYRRKNFHIENLNCSSANPLKTKK